MAMRKSSRRPAPARAGSPRTPAHRTRRPPRAETGPAQRLDAGPDRRLQRVRRIDVGRRPASRSRRRSPPSPRACPSSCGRSTPAQPPARTHSSSAGLRVGQVGRTPQRVLGRCRPRPASPARRATCIASPSWLAHASASDASRPANPRLDHRHGLQGLERRPGEHRRVDVAGRNASCRRARRCCPRAAIRGSRSGRRGRARSRSQRRPCLGAERRGVDRRPRLRGRRGVATGDAVRPACPSGSPALRPARPTGRARPRRSTCRRAGRRSAIAAIVVHPARGRRARNRRAAAARRSVRRPRPAATCRDTTDTKPPITTHSPRRASSAPTFDTCAGGMRAITSGARVGSIAALTSAR